MVIDRHKADNRAYSGAGSHCVPHRVVLTETRKQTGKGATIWNTARLVVAVESSLSDPFEGSSVVFSAASGSVGEYPADSARQPTTCLVAKNNPSPTPEYSVPRTLLTLQSTEDSLTGTTSLDQDDALGSFMAALYH